MKVSSDWGWKTEIPEDLTREPFYGGEQWTLPNGRIVARAVYSVGPHYTAAEARSAGALKVIFDDYGIYVR